MADRTMFVVDSNRLRVSIFRVPESALVRRVLDNRWAHAFSRLGDAKASACRMADGRRVLVERSNGTFRPVACGGGRRG